MKSFGTFSEDIETRRQLLKQKQQDQLASFKEKGAGVQQAAGERLAALKDKNAAEAQKAAKKKKVKSEGYQRNPEKGEEEERKAEKRRKESGRMPPRGDKRREDFERWYAANVRLNLLNNYQKI